MREKMKALVVDDDHNVRKLVVASVQMAGFDVITACDGEEAVEKAVETEQLDLLVSDMDMPVLRGVEAAKQIRQRHPKVPALFVSGGHKETCRQEIMDGLGGVHGKAYFVQKPFSPERLANICKKLVDKAVEAE